MEWLVVLVVVAVVAAVLVWRSRRLGAAAAAERARVDEVERQRLRAEVAALADDVRRCEADGRLVADARPAIDAAVSRCAAAQAALEETREPIDLVRVARVVAEGRYSLELARAIIEHRDPPVLPVELRRPGRHGEPAVTLDERRRPRYVGYPGGFEGGWFGSPASGLFSGLLLGSMFVGGWGGAPAPSDHGVDFSAGADFGDGGGGDFGGGDFGGGDFGGSF